MIDPERITNHDAADHELEEHLLFWIAAAGKNGRLSARLLDVLLSQLQGGTPFEKISSTTPDELAPLMKDIGFGCHTTKARGMWEAATRGLNLRECTLEDLEAIHGVGQKTSRCFLLHSRGNARVAALDTHVLKFLRSQGHNAPKSTPTSKRQYEEFERIFLRYADDEGKHPAHFDLEIWNRYSKN